MKWKTPITVKDIIVVAVIGRIRIMLAQTTVRREVVIPHARRKDPIKRDVNR